MNRKYFTIILILISVALVSAQGCARDRAGAETPGPFVGGNDGLTFAFLEDAPPAEDNFVNEPIPIEVEVTNDGETSVVARAAEVRLVGSVLSGLFTWIDVSNKASHSASNTAPLEGIERETDFPDTETVTVANIEIPTLGTPSYTASVTAQLCYPYQTRVQVDDLCIPSSDIRAQVGTPECEVVRTESIVDQGDNSGAPIQVTSITERRISNGIALNLEISNKGGGEVIKDSVVCATSIPVEERDRVKVTVAGEYDCTFSQKTSPNVGYVVLRNGLGRLRCTSTANHPATSNTGPAYLDRFRADIDYKYIQEISKTITIENL